MTPDQWRQVERLLAAAQQLSSADRAVFLDRSCPDPKVRREVESLLIHRAPEGEGLRPAVASKRLSLELFCSLRITYGDQPVTSVNTNRLQSLLGYLAIEGERAQSREQLAFLLWPESAESQSRTNLRQLLHNLRRALPAECCLLAADNHTVQLRRDPACPKCHVTCHRDLYATRSSPVPRFLGFTTISTSCPSATRKRMRRSTEYPRN